MLILLGVLARFAAQWVASRFLGESDKDPIVSFVAADTLAGGVLTGAGLLLVTARSPSRAGRRGCTDEARSSRDEAAQLVSRLPGAI